MEPAALVDAARSAVDRAYVPYSEYAVGAALETETGEVVTGCNIEIANYSNSLHAEEVALGSAIRDGHTNFSGLAVVAAADDGATPCGMCRQSLQEFCPPEMPVYCVEAGEIITYQLQELLPEAFGEDNVR